MIVEEVMNKNVKTIGSEASAQEAADAMTKLHIGSLIVIDKGKLVGIVTEWDIMSKVVAQAKNAAEIKVRNIMTKEVIMIGPGSDIEDAAQIILDKGIKKLPVLRGSQLIGIITATDICTAQPKLIQSLSNLLAFTRRKAVAG